MARKSASRIAQSTKTGFSALDQMNKKVEESNKKYFAALEEKKKMQATADKAAAEMQKQYDAGVKKQWDQKQKDAIKAGKDSEALQRRNTAAELSLQRQRSSEMTRNWNRDNQAADRAARATARAQTVAANQAQRDLDRIQRDQARQAAANARNSAAEIEGITNRLNQALIAGALAVMVGIGALGVTAIQNAISLDSMKRGLTAVAGSSQEAEKQLVRLREVAKLPGIGFEEAVKGSIALQAVGFSAAQAEKALTAFARAVALTGGGRGELARINIQLAQMIGKGKVVAQDLKPIIEVAPAVGQAMKQIFGTVDSEQIEEQLKKSGMSIEQFIDKVEDKLLTLPMVTGTAKNAIENFSDAWFVASANLGEAFLPAITKVLDVVTPLLTVMAQHPKIITAIVVALTILAATVFLASTRFAGMTAEMLLTAVANTGLISSFRAVATAIFVTGTAAELTMAQIVIFTGGVAALLIVVGAVVAALIDWSQAEKQTIDQQLESISATKAATDAFTAQHEALVNLAEETTFNSSANTVNRLETQKLTASSYDLKEIYQQLDSASKAQVDANTHLKGAYAALTDEINKLVQAKKSELDARTSNLANEAVQAYYTQTRAVEALNEAEADRQDALKNGAAPTAKEFLLSLLAGGEAMRSETEIMKQLNTTHETATEGVNRTNYAFHNYALALGEAAKTTGTTVDALIQQKVTTKELSFTNDEAKNSFIAAVDAEISLANHANSTTGAIRNQTAAVFDLNKELQKLSDPNQLMIDKTILGIATTAKSKSEALALLKNTLKNSPALVTAVAENKTQREIVDALRKELEPSVKSKTTGGNKPVDEVKSAIRDLEKINQQVEALRRGGGALFDLRMQIEDLDLVKSQMEQILKLRRQLGINDRTLPQSADPAVEQAMREAEIRNLDRQKNAKENIVKESELQLDADMALWEAQQKVGLPVVDALTLATTKYLDTLRNQRKEEKQLTADLATEMLRRDTFVKNSVDFRTRAEAEALRDRIADQNDADESVIKSIARFQAAIGNNFEGNPLVDEANRMFREGPPTTIPGKMDAQITLLQSIADNTAIAAGKQPTATSSATTDALNEGLPPGYKVISLASDEDNTAPSTTQATQQAGGVSFVTPAEVAKRRAANENLQKSLDFTSQTYLGKNYAGLNTAEKKAIAGQVDSETAFEDQKKAQDAALEVALRTQVVNRKNAQTLADGNLQYKIQITNVDDLAASEENLSKLRSGDASVVKDVLQTAEKARVDAAAATVTDLIVLREQDRTDFVNSEEFKTAALERSEADRRTSIHSLADQVIRSNDRIAHQGEDSAYRYQIAWQNAILDVRDADVRATEDMIGLQVQLADKTIYHAAQANDVVMQFLAQQRSLSESIGNFKVGIIQFAFDGVSAALDKIIPKLGGLGTIIKQLILDLAKLELSKLFMSLFGLGPGGSNNGTGFGGIFGGGGGSTSRPGGNTSSSGGSGILNIANSLGGGIAQNLFHGGGAAGSSSSVQNLFHGGLDLPSGGSLFSPDFSAPVGQTAWHGINTTNILSGIGGSAASAGFSLSGLGASIAPMAPLLGLGLGAQLGGGSGLSGILGGAGGLLLGGAAGVGLLGGAGAAVFGTGGALASLGGAAAFLTNPFTIGVGIAILIGAILLNRNKQRRKDETARAQILTDSKGKLTAILQGVNSDRISGADALAQAAQVRSDYINQVSQLKDSKTRRIALETVRELDAIISQISSAAERQDKRKAFEDKFVPTFAYGGSVASSFASANNFSGRVPGSYNRRDDKLIRVSGNEVVLTPQQWQPIKPYLVRQNVPGFANSGGTWLNNSPGPASANSDNGPIIIRVEKISVDHEDIVFHGLRADGNRKVVVETVDRDFRLNRESGLLGTIDTVRKQQ